jgi:hypothetical protein
MENNEEDSEGHSNERASNAPTLLELLIASISGCAPEENK